MRIGLTYKLLLALLGTNLRLVVVMAVVAQWSFQRGFVDYLRQSELEQLKPVAEALKLTYREQGNWGFVRHNHFIWTQYLRHLPGEDFRSDPVGMSPSAFMAPPPNVRAIRQLDEDEGGGKQRINGGRIGGIG